MNFRLKRIVFSTILFAASAVHTSSYAQATREEIFDNIAVTGGVYYAYPAPGVQTKAPKGYEPFYISHFGRHGSRWLISDEEYIRVMEVFEKAHQAGKLTPLGEDVRKRLTIVWADAEGRGGDLSPVGVDQQRGIAERMYQAFPEVFKGAPEMSACATLVIRCVLSMDAFCERLKEFNPQLKIERESSNKYMPYLNFHTQEAMKFTSHKGPWYEEFRKFTSRHIRLVITRRYNSKQAHRFLPHFKCGAGRVSVHRHSGSHSTDRQTDRYYLSSSHFRSPFIRLDRQIISLCRSSLSRSIA